MFVLRSFVGHLHALTHTLSLFQMRKDLQDQLSDDEEDFMDEIDDIHDELDELQSDMDDDDDRDGHHDHHDDKSKKHRHKDKSSHHKSKKHHKKHKHSLVDDDLEEIRPIDSDDLTVRIHEDENETQQSNPSAGRGGGRRPVSQDPAQDQNQTGMGQGMNSATNLGDGVLFLSEDAPLAARLLVVMLTGALVAALGVVAWKEWKFRSSIGSGKETTSTTGTGSYQYGTATGNEQL